MSDLPPSPALAMILIINDDERLTEFRAKYKLHFQNVYSNQGNIISVKNITHIIKLVLFV